MSAESHIAVPDDVEEDADGNQLLRWLFVVALIYFLITAVAIISAGFKSATGGQAEQLFAFATNPFMGLIIGSLATALIQSSSTVTSIIVGLVAGGLPVATAIPMVMGANIGTTITNTLVSLGHLRSKTEFRRAFAAATVHDYFNLLSVVIFLPLEIATGFLQKSASFLAANLLGATSISLGGVNFVKAATAPTVDLFETGASILPAPYSGILMIVLGIALIFLVILFIAKLLKQLMVGRAKRILHAAIGRGPVAGIASGTAVTVIVQSSSTTTSLMVPLAGSGVFGLREIYPFTLGANIGTTITALLASTAIAGPSALLALQIALVHLIYNVVGVAVIYAIPFLRNIPIWGAEWLARVATERKVWALAYIFGVFFVLPGVLIAITASG